MPQLIVSLCLTLLLVSAAAALPASAEPAPQTTTEAPSEPGAQTTREAPSEPAAAPAPDVPGMPAEAAEQAPNMPGMPAEPAPGGQPEPPVSKTEEAARTGETEVVERLTPEQFRERLVGVPLCGVPPSGPLAGKVLCTVHLPDGIAVVAGSGVLARGLWEVADGQICRRSKDDPVERRRCVTYAQLPDGRYRNSDGVEVCLGPCGE